MYFFITIFNSVRVQNNTLSNILETNAQLKAHKGDFQQNNVLEFNNIEY